MAAMFRKAGNRKFRKKNFDADEEEDDPNENHSTDNNAISTKAKVEKVKSGSKIEKTFSTNSLLSFGDDEHEEETEVFQVKKSKESRRLSKKILKEKYKKTKPREHIKEEEESNEKTRQLSPKTDTSKLDALRAELREMSKLDDEDEEEEDNTESTQADGNLKPGFTAGRHEFNIPDAATIHALKKKREMARQLGTGQDYIPLDDSSKGRFDSKSRLIREDENDASDDDDGPISFSVTAKSDQPIFGQVNSEDEEEEEEDEETKRWENEQIRKGVSASQVQQEKEQQGFGLTDSNYQGYNIYPYGGGYSLESTQPTYINDQPSKGQLKNSVTEKPTIESIMNRMKGRLESLQETHRGRVMEKDKIISHAEVSEQSIEKLLQHGRDAERQYTFYQEMRGYVRDLIECLNEKVGDTSRGRY